MISLMGDGAKHAQNALKHSLDHQTTSDTLNMELQTLHQFHHKKDSIHTILFHIDLFPDKINKFIFYSITNNY